MCSHYRNCWLLLWYHSAKWIMDTWPPERMNKICYGHSGTLVWNELILMFTRTDFITALCFNLNTNGPVKLTLLCLILDCTWIFKIDVSLLQSWLHKDLQSWLHNALIMKACVTSNLTSQCFDLEGTWYIKACLQGVHQTSHEMREFLELITTRNQPSQLIKLRGFMSA